MKCNGKKEKREKMHGEEEGLGKEKGRKKMGRGVVTRDADGSQGWATLWWLCKHQQNGRDDSIVNRQLWVEQRREGR